LVSVLFIRHLLIPLFGRHGAGFLSAPVLAASDAGKVPWLIAAVSYYGALDGGANLLHIDFGCRHSFVPQALFGLSLLAFATTRQGVVAGLRRPVLCGSSALACSSILSPRLHTPTDPTGLTEAAIWQANPAYHPAVWAPFVADWQIDLSKPWR
jgi:hypothetical protein